MATGSETEVNGSLVDEDCPVAPEDCDKVLADALLLALGSNIAADERKVDRANTKPVNSNVCHKCWLIHVISRLLLSIPTATSRITSFNELKYIMIAAVNIASCYNCYKVASLFACYTHPQIFGITSRLEVSFYYS